MQSISTSRVCLSKKIEEFLNTKKINKKNQHLVFQNISFKNGLY